MRLLVITQKVDTNDQVLGFMVGWLEALAKQVKSLEVICLEKGDYKLPSNVKVYSLGKESGHGRFKYLFNFYRFLWQLRSQYDAVWVHMNQIYIILGYPLWLLGGKKISLWYAHGSISWSLKLASKLANIIFTSSASGFRLASGKVKIVGQGIDTDLFNFEPNAPREAGLMVNVGRLSSVKKQKELIVGLSTINNLPWRLEFFGSPITLADQLYTQELASTIAQLNLSERVTLAGSVSHYLLPARLREAEVFVTMSRTGSLDKAVLEAMSSGVIPVTLGETFRPILGPYGHILASSSETDLVNNLVQVISWSETEKKACRQILRQEIVNNHSLKRLMTEIVTVLKNV